MSGVTKTEARAPIDRMIEWAGPLSFLWRTRAVEAVLALAFAVILGLVATFGLMRAEPNWDAFAYTAVALESAGESNATLHARAYSSVKSATSPGAYMALTEDGGYRSRQATDPDAFASMLPMYRVKPGYTALLRASHQARPWDAALIINAISLALIGLLSLVWLARSRALAAAPVVLLALLAFDIGGLVGTMTPALPAAALLLAALWLHSEDRPLWAIVPLVLATTLRPDTVLLAFALVLAFALTGRRLLPVIAGFAATIAVYLFVTNTQSHIGWWPHYVFSNVTYQDTMQGFAPDFSVAAYLKGIARGVFLSLADQVWAVMALCIATAWLALVATGKAIERRTTTLLLAILLAVGGKFVTFPLPDDRIYLAFAIAALILVLGAWKPKLV